VPYILWDNIENGTKLSCPHVERSCTSPLYSDRVLGVSETATTAATTIHLFTGNNIGTRGDLASRNITVKFTVDRPDPENRSFAHPDPVGWTEKNRVAILRALYTVLLGNPTLDAPADADMRTRFKMWYRLVGSAVEHAAALAVKREAASPPGQPTAPKPPKERVDFQALFYGEEDESMDDASLAEVLYAMAKKWPEAMKFTAADVASDVVNNAGSAGSSQQALFKLFNDFFFPDRDMFTMTAVKTKEMTNALRRHAGNVVRHVAEEGGKTVERSLALRATTGYVPGQRHGLKQFWVWADPEVEKTT
jgi:hypothetical protein